MTDSPFDDVQLEPPVGPPVRLLFVAGAILVAAASLTPFASTPLRLIAYVLAALLSAVTVGVFRYIDGRRRVRASYRLLGWARPAAASLLVIGWVLASVNAWLLATTWAR